MKETRKYKQTELGLLPEDWEVARLGGIGYFLKGNGISKSQANSGNLRAVRYGELYTLHHNYIKTYNSHISKEVALFATKIKKGDILFACSGETKEEIGKCAAFVDEVEAYAGGDILILRTDQEKCSDIFLGFLLNMPIAANQKAAKGQGDAVVHISKASLGNISIPLPPIEEQRRIASALSSIDNLIDSLDRLISKKRDIKQGAMQQLLSGKKRLKGFTEPWVEKILGDVASQKSYGVGAEAIEYNGVDKYIRITDITDDGTYLPAPLSSPSFYQSCHIVGENDLLIARTGASVGKTYLYNPSDGRLIFAGFLMKIQIVNADSHFVFYLTQTTLFKQWVVSESMRSGQPGINLQQISSWTFFVPSLPEQQAIASVLTSMDNELSALEAKRKKYEQIKQGMMQQLLTGRIRFENASTVH